MTPLNARGRNGPALLVPGDYPFTEVSLLDPTRSGERSCELLIGRPAGIGDRLVRVTAPHPRDPALPGVNTYLLGTAETGIAVIDPGPADPHHREALLAHAAGAIRWIICTHTHRAHAGGAADLARVTGAQLIGCAVQAPDPEDVDSASLHFDHQPHDGERLALGGIRLDVIATPGHADNHLCFLAPDDHILFTGDHLAQGPHGTRVATAPGSMNGLIEAFRRLREYGSIHLAPGHGFLMSPAHEMFERAITDQVGRENRVLRALREASVGSPSELLTIAFHDIDEAVRTRWTDTLLAHLARLEAEGRARRFEDRWQSVD